MKLRRCGSPHPPHYLLFSITSPWPKPRSSTSPPRTRKRWASPSPSSIRATGTLSAPKMAIETRDPAHFTLSADGRHLYMCNTGTPGGVSAFAVDKKTGALRAAELQGIQGPRPQLRERGRQRQVRARRQLRRRLRRGVFAGEGWLARSADRVRAAHRLERASAAEQAVRALVPHGPDQQVWRWWPISAWTRWWSTSSTPRPASSRRTIRRSPRCAGGMGPRHLAFHPNGKWVYGIAELANEVMAFNWDGGKGALTQFQSVKTLADGFKDPSTAAEIARACGRQVPVRVESRRRQHRGVCIDADDRRAHVQAARAVTRQGAALFHVRSD